MQVRIGTFLLLAALAMVCSGSKGCTGAPSPITAIFFLDSSASSAPHREEAIHSVMLLTQDLQRTIDHISVYRLNDKVNNLYAGDPIKKDLKRVLNDYLHSPQDRAGTAYGTALLRGLEEAKQAKRRGDEVALFVLGDLADEPVKDGRNLDDGVLKSLEHEFPSDGVLAFLFADPRYSDRVYRRLHPKLGEHFRSLTPQTSENMQVVRELYRLLGR